MRKKVYSGLAVLALGVLGVNLYFSDIDVSELTASVINDEQHVVLKTDKGDIDILLFTEENPVLVDNFYKLAKEGRYNDTIFHRVIPGFMIQAGDYENGNGTGGEAFKGGYLDDSFPEGLSHERGYVSMANKGPNTNGSQFFILLDDYPHLDGRHSIIGQVVSGMNIAHEIAEVDTDFADKPKKDLTISRALIK
jgi:peptidyl-prolyl cis-trans isomerase B (cyclophilin B)